MHPSSLKRVTACHGRVAARAVGGGSTLPRAQNRFGAAPIGHTHRRNSRAAPARGNVTVTALLGGDKKGTMTVAVTGAPFVFSCSLGMSVFASGGYSTQFFQAVKHLLLPPGARVVWRVHGLSRCKVGTDLLAQKTHVPPISTYSFGLTSCEQNCWLLTFPGALHVE